jgi:putative hemolysin
MKRIEECEADRPIKLTYASLDDPAWKRLSIQALEMATGRRKLERLCTDIQAEDVPPQSLWGEALARLSVSPRYDSSQLAKVPRSGPVVFISNHPFGVVDGLILGHLVSQVRSNFILLVNEVFCRHQWLDEHLLPIDFRPTPEALRTNIRTRQAVMRRLKAGEALGIFPAGGVATTSGFWGTAQDLEWKRFVAKVIQVSGATVVPLYVHGQNSRLFQVVSQFSMTLRLGLLLHEVCNKMGNCINVTIGDPIRYASLSWIKGRTALLNYLREATFGLAHSGLEARTGPLPAY